jgi:hypothetical protein
MLAEHDPRIHIGRKMAPSMAADLRDFESVGRTLGNAARIDAALSDLYGALKTERRLFTRGHSTFQHELCRVAGRQYPSRCSRRL